MLFGRKKRTKKNLGWVADFCPICRVPRAFRLFRIGAASTHHGMAVNQGEFVGFELECTECATFQEKDTVPFLDMEKSRPRDLPSLIAKTYPALPKAHEKRLETERLILTNRDRLDPERRRWLLSEPFQILDHMLDSRVHGTHLDGPAAFGCFATLAIMLAAFWAGMAYNNVIPPKQRDFVQIVAASVIGLGILYTFIQMALVPRRYVRQRILPNLKRALEPLAPTRNELQDLLVSLERQNLPIAKRVQLDALWAHLHPGRIG